jgi:hypothetical protein
MTYAELATKGTSFGILAMFAACGLASGGRVGSYVLFFPVLARRAKFAFVFQ